MIDILLSDTSLSKGKVIWIWILFVRKILILKPRWKALATPVGADDPNTRDLQLWNKHAEMLPWIREYRNKSAHELTPISHNDMDNICKLLFSRKELDTILKLIQRQ